jgi:aryl carrier-like protein
MGVDDVLHHFEVILLDILNRENCHAPRPPQAARHTTPVLFTMQAHDDVEELLGESVDVDDLIPLSEMVSKFFGFPSERLHPDISLISLGLDSIRSVGLSKILRQHGYSANAMDIMGNPSLRKLSVLCARSLGHSVRQVESDQGVLSLQKQYERIKASLDPSVCKLFIDDEVEIFPTTALQAGMLSQVFVSLPFSPVVPHSQGRLKDNRLCWKPVFSLIRP